MKYDNFTVCLLELSLIKYFANSQHRVFKTSATVTLIVWQVLVEWRKISCYLLLNLYRIFFIHSPTDGHSGCFCVSVAVNTATMNTGLHASFRIMSFLYLDFLLKSWTYFVFGEVPSFRKTEAESPTSGTTTNTCNSSCGRGRACCQGLFSGN